MFNLSEGLQGVLLAGVISLLSGAASSYFVLKGKRLDNQTALDQKRIELYETKRIEALDEYVHQLAIINPKSEDDLWFSGFLEAHSRLCAYVSPDMHKAMNRLVSDLVYYNTTHTVDGLYTFEAISDDISKLTRALNAEFVLSKNPPTPIRNYFKNAHGNAQVNGRDHQKTGNVVATVHKLSPRAIVDKWNDRRKKQGEERKS